MLAGAPRVKNMRKMGMGVFPSVDAYADAVINVVPFDAMKTWNEQEI